MSHTALITTEKKHEYPILIVDKKGDIGEALAKELEVESLVVFVSQKDLISEENIVHVPFKKRVPTIPDNKYSHIFVIDEYLEFADSTIKSFVKKAKMDDAMLVFCTNSQTPREAFLKKLLESYKNTKVILLGDIFSESKIFNINSDINKFIYQAKKYRRIEVPGDGTSQTNPVFFKDVILGILETVFSDQENHNLYYLFPRSIVTLIGLSNMFQRIDPEIKIDFIKETEKKQKNFFPVMGGIYLLSEKYDLFSKLKQVDLSSPSQAGEEVVGQYHPNEKSNTKINLSAVVFFLLIFLLLPLFFTIIFSFVGVNSLYSVKSSFEKNNLTMAKASASLAVASFNLSEKSISVLSEEAGLIGQKNKVEEYRKKISSAENISEGILSLIEASEKLKNVLSGKSKDPDKEFNNIILDFKKSFYIYNKEKDSGIIPVSVSKKVKDLINISSATIDFWPDILGFNKDKTYLILFQNNMELRPGGGFIGSYAIVHMRKGSIKDFKIYDVYDADGQLKAHIEPPFPVRRYLPSPHWYLRDSNFNVDFSKGAVASAIFLNSEMHQQVDGIIGVDLSFIKNLIEVTGPIKVPDYNETITTDNFYQITQSHAEKDFFPGSTQKKDFLKSFYNSLLLSLSENNKLSYMSLFNNLTTSIYEKHVLFAFNNPNEQALFSVNGWSSALVDDRKNEDNNINDFIGINEANLGANKVNYYISRSLSQKVNISKDGKISEEINVALKNNADVSMGERGNYKNYIRFILPVNTKISSIEIDEKEQKLIDAITDPVIYEKKNFATPSALEVYKEKQGSNDIYGFLINLKAGELKTIKLEYTLDKTVNLLKENTYSLKIFKQPGVDFIPYEYSLSTPEDVRVVNSTAGLKEESGRLYYSNQITKDTEIRLDFSPK
jgi:hypothetical protein